MTLESLQAKYHTLQNSLKSLENEQIELREATEKIVADMERVSQEIQRSTKPVMQEGTEYFAVCHATRKAIHQDTLSARKHDKYIVFESRIGLSNAIINIVLPPEDARNLAEFIQNKLSTEE